jgi:hypothetical protein
MQIDPRIRDQVREHPFPLTFVTISGAHLYGFPSPDSDYDVRGVHVLPPRDVLGLDTGRESSPARSSRRSMMQTLAFTRPSTTGSDQTFRMRSRRADSPMLHPPGRR